MLRCCLSVARERTERIRPRVSTTVMFAVIASIFLGVVGIAGQFAAAGETTWAEREERYRKFIDFGSMVKGGTVEPHWMADGNRFWYASTGSDGTTFFVVDAEAGTREPLFDEPQLRGVLAGVLGREVPGPGLPFNAIAFEDDETAVTFTVDERTFRLELETYQITEPGAGGEADIPTGAGAEGDTSDPPPDPDAVEGETDVVETPSPDGRWIVVTRDHNLWFRAADSDQLTQLTTDGEEDFPWGTDEAQWTSNDDRFAVQRYDIRGVHKMPVVSWLGREETVDWQPYAVAGGKPYQMEIDIVDLAAGKVIRIDTGDQPDQLLVMLGWRPDDSEFMFLRFGPGMKQVDLMAADAATGAVRAIVTDRQDTFIEGLHLYHVWDCFYYALDDDEHFIWRSERDGWAHFYLYRKDGTLVRQLTRGQFEVHKVLAVDSKAGWIYCTAQADPDRPYDRHLYRVDIDGKRMKQLTQGNGTHSVLIAPALTGFVDNHSSVDRPPTAELRRMGGPLAMTLAQADISELEAIDWKPPEEFVVKAADGVTDIYGLMYKPHDFDPARKYPVIEVIYAGSQMTAVPNRFVPREYGHFAQILAQLGFVTVVIDARGTPGRGKDFQDVVYRNIGRYEIPDHVAALRQLAAERPYMDMERVGVHGKSWGGYFALRAMLQAPEVYHVGVASAIAADLETTAWYPIAPYMESPEENPEGYEFGNCLEWADKLQGKLLITAATGDVNTPFAQTMRMVEAFIQAGKPVDLTVFPDQHHWLQGESLGYFYETLKDYFVEHLKPRGRR